MKKVLLIPLAILSLVFYLFDSYLGLLFAFSAFLIFSAILTKGINVKIFSIFFFGYLLLPFLNISEYRGVVSIETLSIYCITQLMFLIVLGLVEKPAAEKSRKEDTFGSNSATEMLYIAHLAIVFSAVLYVYAAIGPIIIRQDLRFNIPPSIEYVIKSALVLPLFWLYYSRDRVTVWNVGYKYFLPIVPSLLIGSRGTFLIVVVAIFISVGLFKKLGPERLRIKFIWFYKNSRILSVSGLILVVLAIYTGFYLRRDGVDLITSDQVLIQYGFVSDGVAVKAVLPLYLGLRETVGLTNRIIEDGIQNPTNIPLFFSEMITFLPGHQVAPGIILAVDIYRAQGSDEKYSLTPGIVGGLFMDYGYAFLPVVLIFALLLGLLFNMGRFEKKWRLVYVLTLVQFFHLYHRGFLKLEYFVPYVVLAGYFLTLTKIKLDKYRM